MIQLDFALAVPGTATAPRDPGNVADYATHASAFQDYLLGLEREVIRLEEIAQREPRRDPDPEPPGDAGQFANRSVAAERPIENPPPRDNPPEGQVVTDAPAPSDEGSSERSEVETPESADEPLPTEGAPATGSVNIATIHGPPTAEESPSPETPSLGAALPDSPGIAPHEIAKRTAQQARLRAGRAHRQMAVSRPPTPSLPRRRPAAWPRGFGPLWRKKTTQRI